MDDPIFHGERLTLARQWRALNLTKLAKLVGVTPQTISAYEASRSTPNAEVTQKIADSLEFPVSFFYEDVVDEVPMDAASFRSLARMTKAQAHAARSIGQFCIELTDWIDAEFQLPLPDVPDLDPSVIDPEGAAALVRAEWGIGDAPISNVLHLLEAHGVRVYALAAKYREVDAFSFWREDTAVPFILVGTHKTPERAVFDLAHELGHLVLHHDHRAPQGREAETQADAFASSFLMPRADVLANAPKFPTLSDLIIAKKRWKVSVAALNYRLHKLGWTTDWHYRSLCIDIGRLGRSMEPESLPREQSQVLTKVLAAMRAEDVGRAQIAEALHVYESDLDSVLSGLVVSGVEGGGETVEGERPKLRLVSG